MAKSRAKSPLWRPVLWVSSLGLLVRTRFTSLMSFGYQMWIFPFPEERRMSIPASAKPTRSGGPWFVSLAADVGWAPVPQALGARVDGTRASMQGMQVIELCRSCRHEGSSHRQEDGRCLESVEMLEGESGVDVAVPCDCPGWPGHSPKVRDTR